MLHTLLHQKIFYICVFICCSIIAASIVTTYTLGYYSLSESEQYLPFYLGTAPFLTKIFYYPVTDLYYRARELSIFFNYLDTKLLLFSTSVGIVHFLSTIYFISVSLIVLVSLLLARRFFGNRALLLTTSVLAAFLTTPAVFFSGYYFRTGKILVALEIICGTWWLFYVSRVVQPEKIGKKTHWLFWGALFIVLSLGLLDELGIIAAVFFTLFSAYILICNNKRSRVFAPIAYGFFSGCVVLWLYRNVAGPWLIMQLFHIQASTWGVDGIDFFNVPNILSSAQHVFLMLSYFFGNIPAWSLGIPIAVIWIFLPMALERSKHGSLFFIRGVGISAVYILAAISIWIGIIHVMTSRNPSLVWPGDALAYYPLPFYGFLFVMIHLLMLKVTSLHPKFFHIVTFLCCVWAIVNIMALKSHIAVLLSPATPGHVYYLVAPKFVEAVQHPEIPIENYHLGPMQGAQTLRHFLAGKALQ